MSNSRRGVGFWLQAWLPVAIGVSVIALESTASFGADHTSGPLRWVWEYIFGRVATPRWETIHHYIRKTGHFVGYGLLGLIWFRAWRMTRPGSGPLQHAGLALGCAALVACSDEWHQSFLPNRTASPLDVMLDCCGIFVFLVAGYGLMRIFMPRSLDRTA